jgi:hypothetical protein
MRVMVYQSTTKFLPDSRWFLGSLQFITDKFGDLTLQEPESHGILELGTKRLRPAPVRVGLINEAQQGHGLSELGKTGSDPKWDKADQICLSPPESNSEGIEEVYMVGNGEKLLNKTIEEIKRRLP